MRDLLPLLRCPVCRVSNLACDLFDSRNRAESNGVVWCRACRAWYPVELGVLDMLSGALAYQADREQFWLTHRRALEALNLRELAMLDAVDVEPQRRQQTHFDWYAKNDAQTYSAYEASPFWQAVDELTFARWRPLITADSWVLDAGCAQGRSAAKLKDIGCRIIGFDVSKQLVRQAAERSRREQWRSQATFLVADGSCFPFGDATFDAVLVYGVLHHLPEPSATCNEIARVLKPGGWFFGSENNRTMFRALFDLVQRVWPIWHEEAGSQPLISRLDFQRWFEVAHVTLDVRTMVFLPPHALNLVGVRSARTCLRVTERLMSAIPGLRNHGGLIVVTGRREQDSGRGRTPRTQYSGTVQETEARAVLR